MNASPPQSVVQRPLAACKNTDAGSGPPRFALTLWAGLARWPMLPPRIRNLLSHLAALAVLLGISAWRSKPAFARDFYAVEGGTWLLAQWDKGFWYCLTHIRGDYLTVVNQLTIAAGNLLALGQAGHPLSLKGPLYQHWATTVYVGLLFYGMWSVIRRHHGSVAALAVVGLAFLMPDNDPHHVLFGEPSNVGFFSSLAVVFVYYDLLLRGTVGWVRMLVGAGVVVASVFTSPLAAVTGAGLAAVLAVRILTTRRDERQLSLSLVHGFLLLLCVGIVWHGVTNNPYAGLEKSGADASLAKRFVELFFGRQIAFPLLVHNYRDCTDGIVLAVSFGIFLLVGSVAWLGWKRDRGSDAALAWWAAPALLLVACGAAGVTLAARKAMVVDIGLPYAAVQSRYFLAQHILVVLSLGITLVQAAKLFPRCKAVMLVGLTLWIADYANIEQQRLTQYFAERTPRDAARAWGPSLARVLGTQSLTGDWQSAAKATTGEGLALATCIGIPGFRMEVPFELLHKTWPDGTVPMPLSFAVDRADAAAFKLAAKAWSTPPKVSHVSLSARPHGVLLQFDLEIDGVRLSSESRRVWISGLPANAKLRAFPTMVTVAKTGGSAKVKPRENYLIRVCAFVPEGLSPEAVAKLPAALEVAVGKAPGEVFAVAKLKDMRLPAGWSSLQTDPSFTSRLYPRRELLVWKQGQPGLNGQHLTVSGKEGVVPAVTALPFDEAAYLQLNTDVAKAVQEKVLVSGAAHFAAFGKAEGRDAAMRSLTLALGRQDVRSSRIDGVEIVLVPDDRDNAPSALLLTLRGAQQEEARLTLMPVESTRESGAEFRAYYLGPWMQWPDFAVQTLEIGISGMADGGKLTLNSVRLLEVTQ